MAPDPDRLVPAAEYGERHGVSATAVVIAIRDGVLPGERRGRVWMARDVPLPDALRPRPSRAEPVQALPEAAPLREAPRRVARFESRLYVSILMALLGLSIAADVGLSVIEADASSLRGVGTRLGLLALLWRRHRWSRTAVQVWAAFAAIGGASGLAASAAAGTPAVDAGFVVFFAALLVVGLFYLTTAHRYIRIVDASPEAVTLDGIRREADL